jgi:hypothetical protein
LECVEGGRSRVSKVKSAVRELTLVGGGGAVSVIHDYAFLERALHVLVVIENDFLVVEGFVDGYVHRGRGEGRKET